MPNVCALTGNEGKFVECHLYPRSFYKDISSASLRLMSGTGEEPFKRAPAGIYDKELVVENTERWFSELDTYAHRLLVPFEPLSDLIQRSSHLYKDGDDDLACEIDAVDHERLSLFALSVLWRFAASARPETDGVNLGPHIEELREILIAREIPANGRYRIVVQKLVDGEAVPIIPPTRIRLDGVNAFEMVFGGFSFCVKTDKRRFPSPFDEMEIARGKPLLLLFREYKKSRGYAALVVAAKRAHAKFGNPWGQKR